MRFTKKTIALACFALFFSCPALVCTMQGALADTPGPACPSRLFSDVDFRWAFVADSIKDGKRVTGPVSRNMALKSGDKLKMMVELQKRCFVYLFHYDEHSGIKLLFPYTLEQLTQHCQTGTRYSIPRADGWFRLDNTPGREFFYLIASASRLDGLEKAYAQYSSAPGEAKAVQGKALLERIKALSKEHPDLCSPAERPVTIGGALRSVKSPHKSKKLDIAAFADEIVSKGFTARTYTIEHN
jgi:hypothetical protein